MKHRRTKKRLRGGATGGALVGKGGYGCGFFPGLPCSSSITSRHKSYFTKVMRSHLAQEEFALNENVRNIDPDMKFSIYPSKICKPTIENIKDYLKEGISKCDANRLQLDEEALKRMISMEELVFMQSPYGGPDLQTIFDKAVKEVLSLLTIYRMFEKFENVFKGLAHFHEHDFCHTDIKSYNIVCDAQCKFIDFGLARKSTAAIPRNDPFPFIIEKKVANWPLDGYFVYNWPQLQKTGLTMEYAGRAFVHLKEMKHIPPEIYDGQIVNGKYHRFTTYKAYHDYYTFIYNTISAIDNSKTPYLSKSMQSKLLKAHDVFCLGEVLAAMCFNLFRSKMQYGEIVLVDKNIDRPFAPIILMEVFYDLVKQMMHLNPFKRFTAKEAYESYQDIMKFFRYILKLFNKQIEGPTAHLPAAIKPKDSFDAYY